MASTQSTESDRAVLYDRQDDIVVITLNRPEALNSINRQLKNELEEALLRFDQDRQARVAIVTGAGRAFGAGRDLKERAEDNAAGIEATPWDSMRQDNLYMWPQVWKPLIAAINGYALAGGWSIAQMCDIRIAAEHAKFGITESRVGLMAPYAVMLPSLIPTSIVMELVMTGEHISAQRAYEVGFVNKVVPDEQLMDESMAVARKIADNSPLSNQYFKEAAYKSLTLSSDDSIALMYHLYEKLLNSEDSVEGPRAFAEKRKPQWKGI